MLSLHFLFFSIQGSYDTDCDSTMSGVSEFDYDPELERYDPFSQDPIFQIEELTFLTEYMHKFKTIPNFDSFYALLDAQGHQTLASINIRP